MRAFHIKGFEVLEIIQSEEQSIIYKAVREDDQKEVLLKTALEKASSTQVAHLKNEYNTLEKMNLAGADKVIDFIEGNQRPVMVLEDFGGISLKEYCTQTTINLKTFLSIAIKITSILSEVHTKGLMHKNLNPSNILINKKDGEIRLSSFGKATNLALEHSTAYQTGKLYSFQYISPEQTGRMNRPTDHRTDLYSLGIIFYEMLAGELPFLSSDPLELVHAHIAKKIAPLTARLADLPKVVSDIILKLTEKIAEDRYQTASGLLYDLNQCLSLLKIGKEIPDFIIAQKDIFSKFRIPDKLYGREEEIKTLMNAYQKVEQGGSKLLFINGFSGVGKTALVNEVHKPTARRKGYFISGKFDQFQFNIPFHAFASAFSDLAKYLLCEPDYRLRKIKNELLEVLGTNTSVLIELIPAFELILGEQPSVQALNPGETQNRFFFTLFEFVRVFAKKEHPLCIFIDDLQWCDDSSLRLIKELIIQEIPYLYIIGSYRDNEVDEGHPLSIVMNKIQETKTIEIIKLEPLKAKHVNELVAETLDSNQTKTAELSNLIFKQTAGNPFFIYELLKSIHSDDLIHFNHAELQWNWDIQKIAVLDVSSHAVELMTKRLKELSPACTELLKIGACLGNTFDLKTLAIVSQKKATDVASTLFLAVGEDIITPTDENYLFVVENEDFGVQYKFRHDSIQQSAYQLLEEDQRRLLHLQIGRTLLENSSEDDKKNAAIDLVRHYNEAKTLIKDEQEIQIIIKLNMLAGQKAQSAIAYQAAMDYFQTSIDLLPSNSWETDYEDTFKIHTGFAQNAYQVQNLDAAENAIDLLVSKAKTKLEKVKILSLKLRQYSTLGKNEEAVNLGIEGLKLLGYKLPPKPGTATVLKEVISAKWNLGKKTPFDLLNGKVLEDPEKLAAARLMMEIGPSAYVTGNSNLYGLTNLKVVNLSLKHGICPESSFAFISFGAVLGDGFGDYKAQEEFGQLAIAINQKFDNIEYRCRTLAAYGVLTHHLNHHWSTQKDFFEKGLTAGYASGDLFFLAYCANNAVRYHPNLSLSKILAEQQKFLKITTQTGYEDAILAAQMNIQYTKNQMGITSDSLSFDDSEFSEKTYLKITEEKNYGSGIGFFKVIKAKIFLFNEKYELAIKAIEEADKYKDAMFSLINLTLLSTTAFFASSGWLLSKKDAPKSKLKKRMKKELARMKKLSNYNPSNFSHWLYLMQAELEHLDGNHTKATRLYEKSISTVEKEKWLDFQAFANEITAKFYLRTGATTASKAYFEAAYSLYENRENFRKMDFLTHQYSNIFPRKITVQSLIKKSNNDLVDINKDVFQELDVATLFKSHQAISGEIELSTLLEKMMHITMMNAGAENGMLFLKNNEQLFLQAAGKGDSISTMQNMPIQKIENLPQSIINFVSRTQESTVLDNAYLSGQFTEDPYILQNNTKSILCSPIVLLNQLYGVIYLENNISEGAFTEDRLKTLSLLSSQMAISIQNALLYSNLEEKVEERTIELNLEKKKSDELLHNILPVKVANELKKKGSAEARLFKNTTVLFTDFVGFTKISASLTPAKLVNELNDYFTKFDEIMEQHGLEKIKSIGDAFMAISGIPNENEDHAERAIRAAIEILDFVKKRKSVGGLFDIRIGLHSGPVIAGIVGVKKFAYDIWGDTVNTAAHMESSSHPGKINISKSTYLLLNDKFRCTHRGQLEAKGKGAIDMYFVEA